MKDHKQLLKNSYKALKACGKILWDFGGFGNCANFIDVIQKKISEHSYAQYFKAYEWPWFMPSKKQYMDFISAIGFSSYTIKERNKDRYFSNASEMIRWIDQPCLVPFLKQIPQELKESFRKAYSDGPRAKVNCYGANDVVEGVAIMWKEGVDVSITGNSTNPTRFQHPVAGTYKKECVEKGKKYFSVASGGGTGRTLHPDNMAAGPASYGMTDTLGRMHSDAQFAGSSSVPAHVEMMGLIGAGNNPMVGMTVAVAVSIQEAAEAGKF